MANICGNIALGNARQINANIHLNVFASEKHDPELVTKTCRADVAKLLEPLILSKREKATPRIENNLLAGNRSTAHQSSPDHKHPKRDLSILKPFQGESERATAPYRRIQGGAIGSRFALNWDRIGPWLESKESTLLAVRAPSDEATKLTLETIMVVDLIIKRSQQNSQDLRLVHLFGSKPHQKKGNPNIMILDLISQVMKHHEKNNESARSPDDRIRIETADPKLLWETFWQRAREAGIHRLFIFLDNVDQFFLAEAPSDPVKRALRYLVGNLKPPIQQSGFQIKVWVTCNTRNMEDCFR